MIGLFPNSNIHLWIKTVACGAEGKLKKFPFHLGFRIIATTHGLNKLSFMDIQYFKLLPFLRECKTMAIHQYREV